MSVLLRTSIASVVATVAVIAVGCDGDDRMSGRPPLMLMDGGGGGVDGGSGGVDGGGGGGGDDAGSTGPADGTLCGACLATDPPSCASPSDACLSNSETGQVFCGQACSDGTCPSGFICATISGAPAPQCVPESGICDMGGGTMPPPDPGAGCGEPIENEELALTNGARAEAGLPPLVCDDILTQAARLHSQDQCDQGRISHTGSDGSTVADRVSRLGGTFRAIGENVAMGQTTPRQVHDAWMASPGHRSNILGTQYRRIGIGYVACGGTPVWTQDFTD
jgi:hypothetical protein